MLAYLGGGISQTQTQEAHRGTDMYETGFDVDAIVQRLKTTFPVEQSLPMKVKLALAHLMRAEDEAAQGH